MIESGHTMLPELGYSSGWCYQKFKIKCVPRSVQSQLDLSQHKEAKKCRRRKILR